ncbi:hypothetical protein KP509_10G029900 [Ceratopteris richardii]|nr:hypothetical protein KP509_10G029900 [Ceratopteris richardii]
MMDMYAKCGSLMKAYETFMGLPVRDTVSWTCLIKGYIDHGFAEEALDCFEQMQQEGFSPNAFTMSCSLKACGIIRSLEKGQEIYSEVEKRGLLDTDAYVGSTLVEMYARCRLLGTAQIVFNRLSVRNVVSWTVLIGGYIDLGYGKEALECFENMRNEGIFPTAATYVCVLKTCGELRNKDMGIKIHAEIEKLGLLDGELAVGGSLVDMYIKCGSLEKAQKVFQKLPFWNLVLWNALITGYAEGGHTKKAIECVNLMRNAGILPDSITFISCLKACYHGGDLDKGQEVHSEIERIGFLENDITISNSLIAMYSKLNLLPRAREIFSKTPSHNIVTWNTLIAGYAEHGQGWEALQCLEQMRLENVLPNIITVVCTLKACGNVGAILKGRELHVIIGKTDMLKNLFVLSALVDMYAKNGFLIEAHEIFSILPDRDVVAWTTLISGYADHGYGKEALKFSEEMLADGISPNTVTFICSLKACGSIGAADKAQQLYEEAQRKGLLEGDLLICNSVIDMYSKCSQVSKAQNVFNKLSSKNIVMWNTLLAAYALHGYSEETFRCLERMHAECIPPNCGTFIWILKACGLIGASHRGKEAHAEIERLGLLGRDVAVANSLIDMYVKCNLLTTAHRVFKKLTHRDIATFNSLMVGYARQGDGEGVLGVFDELLIEGLQPDAITFCTVLTVCSATCLFNKHEMYYQTFSTSFGIAPTIEHMSKMIDLLGHVGGLGRVTTLIKESSKPLHFSPWHAILSACRTYGYMKLGQEIFHGSIC